MKGVIGKYTTQNRIWQDESVELKNASEKGYLRGVVLNAGAGWKDISHFVQGELINQDISWPGDERTNIQIFSEIDNIPLADHSVDTVVCIAVLEHVPRPIAAVKEFYRMLKPGGVVVASIPFLQPEHKVPTDFQRYTKDGLSELFTSNGFEIVEIKGLFTVYHTIHWIVYEWLRVKNSIPYKLMRYLFLPVLQWRAKKSTTYSDFLASAFQVIARKPGSITKQ